MLDSFIIFAVFRSAVLAAFLHSASVPKYGGIQLNLRFTTIKQLRKGCFLIATYLNICSFITCVY